MAHPLDSAEARQIITDHQPCATAPNGTGSRCTCDFDCGCGRRPMPDYPPAVLAAVAREVARQRHTGPPVDSDRQFAREILDAAAPRLAEALLTPLAKRHAMVANDWGYHCGTCWVKGNSRAAWPCAELLAIAAILPAAGNVSSSTAATGEEEP